MSIRSLVLSLSICPLLTLSAATVQVSADSASAESDLRTAIANADAGDTIEITSTAANPKITLTSVKSTGLDESLVIEKNLTIVGPNGGVTIDGGWNGTLLDNNTGTRIVKITGSSTAVTFRNITFINGNGTYYNNDIRYLQGGAIYTEGPLTLENCTFRNNVSANFTGNGVYDGSIINGGGAIYAMNGLTIRDCVFENNSTARKNHGYNIWGGAVTMLGGALSVSGSKFSGNSCGSYQAGGSFYVGADVTAASFESSTFTGEHAGIWGDAAEGGGAIASKMSSGSFVVDGCSFTNCYALVKGGAIRCDGVAPIVRNSTFVGCYSSNGGAVYVQNANGLFVNCLFQDNVVKERGAAVSTAYGTAATLVNCSIVGGVGLKTESGWDSPSVYHAPYLRLLNTVIAYNYQNLTGAPAVRDGLGGFSGQVATICIYNTDYTDSTVMFANTKSVTTAVGEPTAVNNVTSIGSTTLEGTISVPEANAIDTNGVLAAGGYPVKMTASGSYIGYSTDGGANWTTFYGDAANAASAVLITNDIRGVNYETGKTPIGAVCGAVPPPVYCDDWFGVPMSKEASEVSTKGTLVWAMATSSNDSGMLHTANGVGFGDCSALYQGRDFYLSDYVTFSPGFNGEEDKFTTEDLAWNDMNFGSILKRGWVCDNASSGQFTMTLKDLVPGNRYLVQILSHNPGDGTDSNNHGLATDTITSPDGQATITYGGTGWKYGGTLYREFTATDTTQSFTFTHSRATYFQVNAIQLRLIEEGVGPTPHEHVWSDWVTNTPPTATTDGQRTRTCTAPGCTDPVATEVEVIPATGGGDEPGGDDPEPPAGYTLGWSARPMLLDSNNLGASFSTVGTQIFAIMKDDGDAHTTATNLYPCNISINLINSLTDTITYLHDATQKQWSWTNDSQHPWDGLYNDGRQPADFMSASPTLTGNHDCENVAGAADNFNVLLRKAFINYSSGTNLTVTFKNLTVGSIYTAEIFVHHEINGSSKYVASPDGAVKAYFAGDGWTYGGIISYTFVATAVNQSVDFAYSSANALQFNAIQLRKVASGSGPVEPVEPTYPSIGSVNSTVLGSAATITLSDVVKGTDTNAAAVFNYSAYLTYTLAGGEAQYAELLAQSAASCSFTLTSLEAGNYTYSAVVTNSAGLGSDAVNGAFTIKAAGASIAAAAAKLLESQGWLAAPMTGNPSDIVTDGYVITNYWNNKTISEAFAYSCNNDIPANDPTVSGVPFHRPGSRALDIYPYWGGNTTAYYYGLHGSNGNTSNVLLGYDRLLTGAWNASDTTNTYTFTILDLEPYETYIVQLIMHSSRGKDRPEDSGLYEKFETGTYQYLRGAVIGGQSIQYGAAEEGDEWWYGGTFVKVFSADRNGQYKFEITYPEKAGLYNAIQVRKVDRSTPSVDPVPAVAPQLASVSVNPTNSFALVTFGGINRGSGTDALMAKSVGLYFAYAPQGSELPQATMVASVATPESTVTALISGLSAGTYNYTAYAKNECGESSPINGSFTIAAGADPATDAPLLVINEIAASNPDGSDGGLRTQNGYNGLDWVEIYNRSDFDIDITGWYLYDDPTKKQSKWKTIQGNGIVPAKGYKIVWCDKDYANFTINEAYSEIGLSTTGENLFLASPDGVIVSQVNFPSQVKGITYGLGKLAGSDEIQYVYFATATPGAANGEYGAGPMTPKVQFSVPHGYKTAAFDVTLSCEEDPSAAIYYTTDGSSPTTSSTLYEGAIHVDHTTCLRAAVPRVNSVMQQDTSVTYIFLDDVLSAEPGVVPEGFPTPTGDKQEFNGQHLRYGMVQSVVNGPDRDRVLRGFTNTIATISIVIDPDNMFSASTGIYVNAKSKYDWQLSPNDEWERQTMIEQIDPVNGAANEFSAPAGIRIRGAGSRGGGYAKHSFKIIFRSKYGLGKLAFPLFGDEGADEFNRFDLRCSQNHSWANEDSISDTFIHEVFSRDSQRDMDQMYTRSRYYNLFINGVYWGLYQSQERGDEDFAATYNGGNADNYDKVRTSYGTGGYRTEVTGSNAGWEALLAFSNQGFAGDYFDNYMKIIGCNPDGTRNPAYPCYLNATNLMAYMISTHFTCDCDCPAAPSLANNLCFLRDRVDGDSDKDGFFFLRHDAEHSLGVRDPQIAGDQATEWSQYDDDPTGYGTEEGSPTKSGQNYWNAANGFNPAELHWQLGKNPLYRRHFGDQFYKQCLRPGGAMTVTNALARFRTRMAEIDDVIVCEAARWSKDASNPKSHEDWLTACGFCIDFITNRTPYMVSQYRNRGWYPSVDTPEPDIWDGTVEAGQVVNFSCADGGAVYVTTDGSDPAENGAVAASGALTLSNAGACTVKARVLKEGEWSALQEVAYTVNAPDNDGYEFILSGDYNTVKTIAPTGTTCKVVLTNANLNAGIVIPAGVTAKFNASTNTENYISYIDAPESEVRFTGDGTVRLEGQDTLATVSNLVVKSGTLEIVSTGVSATKTPVVNVLGFAEQTGGVIDMDLDVVTGMQIYGIYIANKDLKNPDTGKNLGLIYGLFDGGEFNAKIGGWKSAAVYVNKGSVNCTFKGGETINAELTGPEARFANVAGDLLFKRCIATVTMPEDCSSIINARVFKSDKCISVSDGHYIVNTPGPGTEVFSAGDAITVSGGTFELTTDDDCFSALNNITVSGGLFYAVSTANDVFDSNGDMEINGGTILAYATAEGHEAFDVEPELTEEGTTPHQLRINGGVIFATGGKTADWPDDLVATVTNLYAYEDLAKSDYSERYISIETDANVVYAAKLPSFPQSKCAVMVSCPNRTDANPILSASAPTYGDQEFHEYYVYEKDDKNQQSLRFYEIYGNTNQGEGDDAGNVGEYIILTNISDRTVQLQGLVVSSAKVGKKGGIEDPKCLITLGAGTVPAHGTVRLWQSRYAGNGWEKITNGNIFIKLQDATGKVIQSGYASFNNEKYPDTDGGGQALVAIRFDTEMQDTTEYWTSGKSPSLGFVIFIH